MRKLLWLFLALPVAAFAQPSNPTVQYVSMAPSGACSASPPVQVVISTGVMYTCNNGTWAAVSGGGGLPAGCTSSGTGVITCSGAVTGNPLLSGTPSTDAKAALPAGSHGFACDETSTTGVPAAGVDYIRCDSVTHQLVYSINNSAEAPLASAGSANVLISEQVLSSPAASFNFGSIPATYRDLILKCDGSGSGAGDTGITITHNSDTGANYTMTQMYGVGPTTPGTAGDDGIYLANNFAMGNFPGTGRPAGYPGTLIMTILDYKSTVFYKANFTQTSILLLESSGNAYIVSTNGWWKSTAAITSLQINSGAGNFITGSRCSLYGSY